ncbi:hypothetical protein D3C72_61200 [compost metagenome]
MAFPRWAIALGATWLLCSPAWAATQTIENLDFRLSVESISWTPSGILVKSQIENRTGSPDLFLHHAANQEDPESFTFTPDEAPPQTGGMRRTYTLKGLSQTRTAATLVFGIDADEEAGLLIVGETQPPYRQVAIALKPLLPERPAALRPAAARPAPEPVAAERIAPEPAAAREGPPPDIKADAPAPEPGVIQRFSPPHASFGERIVLKEGKAGPNGEGWTRIYTDLPDITFDELKRVLESPAQIWQGDHGFLYMRSVGGQRALAVDVRNAQVISARYVTPKSLAQVVGPRTRYPKRVYMGRP